MSEIRLGHSLNEEEKKHITDRKSTVQQCLKRHNITCSLDEVPNIAVLGSGGGERAMVGLLGSLDQMGKEDLLDCILYLSGVSGSTWCMSALYEEPDWSTNVEQVKKKIIQRMGHDSVSIADRRAKLVKYYDQKDNFSLTDVWAAYCVPTTVRTIDESPLSSHRDGHSKDPYPIFTVIDQDSKYDSLNKDPWFELTPHEAGYSLTGAFVDTKLFGSQFDFGVLKKQQPEMDMLYLQGLCGSALADQQKILNYLSDMMTSTQAGNRSRQSDQATLILQKVVELNLCVMRGEDCTLLEAELNELLKGKKNSRGQTMIFNGAGWQRSAETRNGDMVKSYTLDVCQSIWDWVKDSTYELTVIAKALALAMTWTWGSTYNFLHNMAAEKVDQSIQKEDIRHFEDAGLLLNSPYFSVLRPEREVDLIISLDFSNTDPMRTVKDAQKKCKGLGMPFPRDVVDPEDSTDTKDFYVFKSNGKGPTVIHMPLFNINNCGDQDVDWWKNEYTTIQGAYSPEMTDKLMEKAAMNIRNNKDNLLREIEEVIRQKTPDRESKHGSIRLCHIV